MYYIDVAMVILLHGYIILISPWLQDKEDDILVGVRSTALGLGDQTKPWLLGFGSVMVGGLVMSGIMCDQTWPFFMGVSGIATHLLHQVRGIV